MAQKTNQDQLEIDLAATAMAIEASALPEAKKLAYLYLIADGSFTGEDLEKLAQDMDEVQNSLESDIELQKREIAGLEAELAVLEKQESNAAIDAAFEFARNADELLNAAYASAESSQESQKAKEIESIKSKLSS